MGNKVVCLVCLHQVDGFCALKKSKVKLNKRRVCDRFVQDFSRVRIKEKVPTTKRPEWFWSREERRKQYKKELKEYQKQFEKQEQFKKELRGNEEIQIVNSVRDSKYPLTGNLDRFRTTASRKEEE